MEAERDAPTTYRCPSCDDGSPYPVRCDRCDRMMTASGGAAHADEATRAERAWLLAGPLLGLGATWAFGAAVMADGFGDLPFEWWALRRVFDGVRMGAAVVTFLVGPLPFVLLTLLGLWLGRTAAAVKVREARRARRRVRELEAMRATAPASLDCLPDGRVRVVVTITEAQAVYSNRGLACAACENLVDGGPSPTPRHPIGARFVVRDERGRRALVDARHVRVVEGFTFDEEAHVPVGARVELVATARPAATDGTEGRAAYRNTGRVHDLVGTVGEPVLLRVLDAA